MIRQAQCCCGRCEVSVSDEPLLYGVCNCRNCQKRTGSAFGLSAYFREDGFVVMSGSYSTYEMQGQRRYFCENCGTTLYWRAETFKNMVGVAGGCFADSPLPEPGFVSQAEDQCAWLEFAASIKRGLSLEDIPTA